ncbi:MAG: polyhydroxyalkanoic acid system family protein [Betaproteobacteria bacterium]|nr:polyhydroxyalkanoic acid system family protein [Betaproteobacteria bacterium]
MSTIDLRRAHHIGRDKAREAVESIARELRGKLDISYRWDGDCVRFKRTGAEGTIQVADAEVRFQADLGLLLRPLRGTIEREVREYFDRYLGTDQA